MAIYEDKILPWLIDKTCSAGRVMKVRNSLMPEAIGTVLEVGIGSAINLRFYDPDKVRLVYGLEPSRGMRRKARINLANSPVPVEWLDLSGEEIPLPDNTIDTIVLTFTLCTIPGWNEALQQMFRVLRPGGKILFIEHGQSPDAAVKRWQNLLTPGWKKVAGGCHLNRPIADYLRHGGFVIDSIENRYLPKTPQWAGYLYIGVARKPG